MTFKTIDTQEELDKIIEGRLARQKESLEKQYADYDQLKARNTELETEVGALQAAAEETQKTIKEHDQLVSDLNAKVSGYETASLRTKIALQNGLPFDLADRLVGEDEESLKADAERLAGFVKAKEPVPPLKNSEPPLGNDEDSAYKSLIKNLNLEGEE
jgi:septal ring factor EnvC (AmiA/AmiB activator)